jgi:ABC-type transport system involved in cytochrome c biogenesis permease subunit
VTAMPILPPQFWLFQSAFILQLVALALFVGYAVTPRRGLSSAATASLALSLALLLLHFTFLGLHGGRLPLASGFEFVLVWSIALTALVVWAEWRHQLGLLGAFLTPPGALILLMGFRFAKADAQPAAGLPAGWLLLHVLGVVVAFACFTVASGVAGAYLVQSQQLKKKNLGSLSYHLPPLSVLDRLAAGLAGSGLLTLVISLAAGFVWKWTWYAKLGLEDPKVQFAVCVVFAYAGALLLRRRGALQGRQLALLFILLYLIILFGYYLVNIYFGGHGFLQTGSGA